MTTIAAPSRTAALEVEDLEVAYVVRGVPREVLRGVSFEVAPGRGVRARRRVRVRQVDDCVRGAALPPGERADHGRSRARRRRRRHRHGLQSQLREFRATKASMVYQDPAPALNPCSAHRAAGGWSASPCSASSRIRGASSSRSTRCGVCASPIPERVLRALPVPALRRHAATRRHRHGAGLQPEAARARRADHRPRRHRRGRGARPRARAAVGDRRRHPPDRSQPRRHPHDVRPGRRDVRRQDRRRRARHSRCSTTRSTRTPWDCSNCLPRHGIRKSERLLRTIPGTLPQIGSRLADLRVRRPLPARRRGLPDRGRAGRRDRPRRATAAATTSTRSRRSSPERTTTASTSADSHRVVLEMRQVSKTFTPARPRRACTGRRRPRARGGRDARPRGRVGFRQVDAGEGDARRSTRPTPVARSRSTATRSPATTLDAPRDDRRAVQMVFQNPDSALNRNWTVRRILRAGGDEAHRRQGPGGRRSGRPPCPSRCG